MYSVLLRPRFGVWVSGSAVCRYLLVRDCAHIEDVIALEHEMLMREKSQ